MCICTLRVRGSPSETFLVLRSSRRGRSPWPSVRSTTDNPKHPKQRTLLLPVTPRLPAHLETDLTTDTTQHIQHSHHLHRDQLYDSTTHQPPTPHSSNRPASRSHLRRLFRLKIQQHNAHHDDAARAKSAMVIPVAHLMLIKTSPATAPLVTRTIQSVIVRLMGDTPLTATIVSTLLIRSVGQRSIHTYCVLEAGGIATFSDF